MASSTARIKSYALDCGRHRHCTLTVERCCGELQWMGRKGTLLSAFEGAMSNQQQQTYPFTHVILPILRLSNAWNRWNNIAT